MATRNIHSRAPTRIDLAGGTLDIWPLYLFLKHPLTINLGIDLFAEAIIDEKPGTGKITLLSEDQGAKLQCTWNTLDQVAAPPSLLLHTRLLQHFSEKRSKKSYHDTKIDLTLKTIARSPAGAGLGGSSALSVAMIGALSSWYGSSINEVTPVDTGKDGERWIDIVRDVETTVIQVPAGLQDYYGAMFGGLQSLMWHAGSHQRNWYSKEILNEVEKRILLFYSGQSRNSGINNWALFKAFIDKEGQVRNQFEAIATATRGLDIALRNQDWSAASAAIASEWEVRRTLAKGISTPEMEHAFLVARQEGVEAGKVCGAGGGGCFFIFIPSGDPELKAKIRDRIAGGGTRPLPFNATHHGLDVQVKLGA